MRCVPVLLLAFLLNACGLGFGGDPQATGPEANPAAAPEVTDTPAPSALEPLDVPSSFPVFDELARATDYVQVMADIHTAAIKNRQPHEKSPQVKAVTGALACPTVPGQTGTMRWVGDSAKKTTRGKPLVIATCYVGDKRGIFFAPYKLDKIRRESANRETIEMMILRVMRDYLAGLIGDKSGHHDSSYAVCTAGRLVGGLRDRQYLSVAYANSLFYKGSDHSANAELYRRARDKGLCPLNLLGATG